jgi:small subunit ribosomal protein S3
MGQKVSPKAIRLGYIEDWSSRWFNLRQMPQFLEEDQKIRKYVKEKFKYAAISRVVIERPGKLLRVNIYTARPGMVIGRKGVEIENLRKELEEMADKKVGINVLEIKEPAEDAQLVAEAVALQIEKRVHHRRAMKKAITQAMEAGALGIKIMVSGRLGGAEIARYEWLKEGRIPLHTFRALIDYGFAEAKTTVGVVGVKVWIFKKELFVKTRRDFLEEAKLVEREEELKEGEVKEEEIEKEKKEGEKVEEEIKEERPEEGKEESEKILDEGKDNVDAQKS